MQPIISGLLGGLIAAVLLGWAAKAARRVEADRQGWRTLRPGVTIWGTILVSAAFSLGLFYVFFFVGSTRADAETQMMYCLVMAIAFGLGSAAMAYAALSRVVSWRGAKLRVRPLLGAPVEKRLDELVRTDFRAWSGLHVLTFADGYVVTVSPYEIGARDLLERIGVEEA